MIQKKWIELFAWALPISLAGGSFLLPVEVGGISFYFFRVMVLLGGIFGAIFFFMQYSKNEKSYILLFFVLLTWLIMGLTSYFYVLDKDAWLKDIFYLSIGFSIFLCLYLIFTNAKEEKFLFGWVTGYICNILFGFFEMVTGSHFSGEMTKELATLSPEHYVHFSPAGFFGNPNHYAFYLVLSFLIFTFFRKKIKPSFQLFLFLPGIWQLFYTYSKFSILAFILIAIYWVVYENKNWRLKNKDISIGILSAVLFFGLSIVSLNFDASSIINPSEKSRIEIQRTNPDERPESVSLRQSLLKNGWQFIVESNGIGIGAGQFSVYILKGKGKHNSGKLSDPHNGIMEIASQYGLIIIGLLIYFYLWWFTSILKMKKQDNSLFVLLSLLCILILSNVNSGFISSPLSWFILILPVMWFPIPLKN